MNGWTLLAAAALAGALAGCDRREEDAAPAPPASGASAPAAAAPLAPQQVPQAAGADAQQVAAGAQLARQGAGAVAACAGCHGASGEGNAQTGFPRLAGLGRLYLVHQLESYADGRRKHPVMQPIAAAMTPEQRQAAAAFYASQGEAASGAATTTAREPALAVSGDDRRRIQACANCHGPQGVGDAAANPYLAGQHSAYLAAALAAWESGERHNDPSGQMPAIAKALTDEEAKALVAYYSGLPPPAPRNAQAAATPLPAQRASVQSGPATGTAPQQGVGTEQGAPLTGGAQGQGAGGAATSPQQAAPAR